MEVAVERKPGSEVTMTVKVASDVIEQRMEQLFQKYARKVSVPGFRPGKAPRKMIEGRIDRGALLQDAIESVIDTTYREALREQNLEPLERGEIEDVQTAEDLSLTYVVRVPVRPEITLPDYADLHVHHTATIVNDEQVENEIGHIREQTADFADVTDEGIKLSDYVTVDYTMTVDGEPYPGGDTTGYPLEVGSDTFFPELNDALLDKKVGDTFNLAKTYPADYSNAELAGRDAVYTITVRQVRRVIEPELTDEWVETVSRGEIKTVDDLRARIRQNLQTQLTQMDKEQVRDELVRQLVDKAQLEVPESMVEEEFQHLIDDMNVQLAGEGMTVEGYAEEMNRTVDDIRHEQHMLARDMVRRMLVLQEVARREQIVVTDKDIESLVVMEAFTRGERELDKIQKQVKTLRREMEESGRLNRLANRLYQEKIINFLAEHADMKLEGLPEPEAAPAEQPAEAPAVEAASEPATEAAAEESTGPGAIEPAPETETGVQPPKEEAE